MMEYADNMARDMRCRGKWIVSGFAREEEAHMFYKLLGCELNGYRFNRPF